MSNNIKIPTMAEMMANGETPDILFWTGCAGSFDERAQKITKAFVKILNHVGTKFAVLGQEESCTGDPARRAGNEFVFQMMAMSNISVLEGYEVKKIVTSCPHCFNTLKNEYPKLGGNFEVIHHTEFLQSLIDEGKIEVTQKDDRSITYHDSCYLGRSNNIYEAPRAVLNTLTSEIKEMKRSKAEGLCCGAGGAQMFKEDEPGEKRINTERVEDALETGAKVIATNCPFCTNMLTDGLKNKNKEEEVEILDVSELIAKAANIL